MAENQNATSNLQQEVILPSMGYLNPEIPEGKIIQRCMMVNDQKFLAGSNLNANQLIDELLNRTVISPEGFDAKNLTVEDTLYLLFKLRILSYGEIYHFQVRCPECGKKITVEVDLSELNVESLDEDYEKNLTVTLPRRGDTVTTKLLRNIDVEEINREVKRRRKRNPRDESEYVLKICHTIQEVHLKEPNKDGKSELVSLVELEQYVNALTDFDAGTILQSTDRVQFGILPEIEYQCPECNEEIDIPINFGAEFFRPSIK